MVQVAGVGVEYRHLAGGGLHHMRVTVAHVGHIVDRVEKALSLGIKQQTPQAAKHVQRLLVA